jgi:hypothetical protein
LPEADFLEKFTEALGADPGTIALDTPLNGVELWDSVAYLAVLTMVDESLGVALPPEQLVAAETPRAILEMALAGKP